MSLINNQKGCTCSKECLTLTKPDQVHTACPASSSPRFIQHARAEYRREGSLARDLWLAFARLVGTGGAGRSRLEHIMEFSRSAGYQRIGLAGCARYLKQMHVTKNILFQFGFQSIFVTCKVGGNKFSDINVDKDSDWTLCNPLSQAMLLNDWNSDLNIVFGLCMGHDLIFQHYSNAPVTTLVVKEKISDDNPVATLDRMDRGEYTPCPYLPGLIDKDKGGGE